MNSTQTSRPATTDLAPGDVCIVRHFDAPRAQVYKAWTEPAKLVQWFAPRGCEVRFPALDVRPGGKFHSCILLPDGTACWCVGEYLELVTGERIVYTIALADENGQRASATEAGKDGAWPDETTVTVTLAEAEGGTDLTLHQTVSEALARKTGAYPSWLDMLDQLAEQLRADFT